MISALLDFFLAGYQRLLAPVLGGNCRYLPSCSEYAREAIRKHGAGQGARLAAIRVGRCHPWAEGGWDPVPNTKADSHA